MERRRSRRMFYPCTIKNKNLETNNVTTGGIDGDGRLNEYENEYHNLAPLSMMKLMHKREKYLKQVFKKINFLESRALTTSSLTAIGELQMILSNQMKYYMIMYWKVNHYLKNHNHGIQVFY